jgi:hypothetical protein
MPQNNFVVVKHLMAIIYVDHCCNEIPVMFADISSLEFRHVTTTQRPKDDNCRAVYSLDIIESVFALRSVSTDDAVMQEVIKKSFEYSLGVHNGKAHIRHLPSQLRIANDLFERDKSDVNRIALQKLLEEISQDANFMNWTNESKELLDAVFRSAAIYRQCNCAQNGYCSASEYISQACTVVNSSGEIQNQDATPYRLLALIGQYGNKEETSSYNKIFWNKYYFDELSMFSVDRMLFEEIATADTIKAANDAGLKTEIEWMFHAYAVKLKNVLFSLRLDQSSQVYITTKVGVILRAFGKFIKLIPRDKLDEIANTNINLTEEMNVQAFTIQEMITKARSATICPAFGNVPPSKMQAHSGVLGATWDVMENAVINSMYKNPIRFAVAFDSSKTAGPHFCDGHHARRNDIAIPVPVTHMDSHTVRGDCILSKYSYSEKHSSLQREYVNRILKLDKEKHGKLISLAQRIQHFPDTYNNKHILVDVICCANKICEACEHNCREMYEKDADFLMWFLATFKETSLAEEDKIRVAELRNRIFLLDYPDSIDNQPSKYIRSILPNIRDSITLKPRDAVCIRMISEYIKDGQRFPEKFKITYAEEKILRSFDISASGQMHKTGYMSIEAALSDAETFMEEGAFDCFAGELYQPREDETKSQQYYISRQNLNKMYGFFKKNMHSIEPFQDLTARCRRLVEKLLNSTIYDGLLASGGGINVVDDMARRLKEGKSDISGIENLFNFCVAQGISMPNEVANFFKTRR